MSANEPVEVYRTNNLALAEFFKSLLEADGIKCELSGGNQGSFAYLFGVGLFVRAWDEARAREILTTHPRYHETRKAAGMGEVK